jgi:hypothetical protein
MFAYFNELSANGSISEGSLPSVINTLVNCIKVLSKKQISGINLDKKIGQYQLTANRWFLDVLDDKTIVDDDMKTLILDIMTTIENPMQDLEEEYFMQATCNGENSIGLGLASEEINNTFAVSLSSTGWEETSYQIILQRLSEDDNGTLVEQDIESSCKNVSSPAHIDKMADFFAPIPASGRELFMQLPELFPHLVFSSKAKGQIKRTQDRPSIEQIYLKLLDIDSAAQRLNGGVLRSDLFHYKASPEHKQRRQLPEMYIAFEDGKTRHCEWHLRYTPGCGRIHFSSDEGDGHTIFVGHVDGKLGMH